MDYKIILVAIIHKNFKKILLIKRNRVPFVGKWSLPGGAGALLKEQDPEKAIKIEVEQDFGVGFEGAFYTYSFEKQPEPTIKLFFRGSLNKEPSIKSTKTIMEMGWFGIDEISKLDIAFNDKEVIERFFKGQ